MRRIWTVLSLASTATLLSGVLFYVALMRRYDSWDQLNLINTALSVVVAGFSGIAGWLFLQGVQSFKPQLRRAYKLLCVGIVIFGISQAQYPIASYAGASFWYLGGLISIPYLAAAIYIFWGIRSLAGVVTVRSRWLSWRAVIVASLAIVPIVAFLPHTRSDFSESEIALGNALIALDIVFIAFGVVATLRVRALIARMYNSALTWLAMGLGMTVVGGLHYIITNLLIARLDNWYWNDGMAIWPFLIGAVLLVRAGYAMVLVGEEAKAQTTLGDPLVAAAHYDNLPLIDIIVYLAGLASKPQEIDPALDILRGVTANLQPGQTLSEGDERKLINVYHTIETYLSTEEPIRVFSATELRRMVEHEFNLDMTAASRLWLQT